MHHSTKCSSLSKAQRNQNLALGSVLSEKTAWVVPPAAITCCVRGSRGKTCWTIPEISASGTSRLIRWAIFHVRKGRLPDSRRMRRGCMVFVVVGFQVKEMPHLSEGHANKI